MMEKAEQRDMRKDAPELLFHGDVRSDDWSSLMNRVPMCIGQDQGRF